MINDNWHIWKSAAKGEFRLNAIYHIDGEYAHSKEIATRLEVSWNKNFHNLGFSINFGNRGSETPFKLMLGLYWVAFYFGLQFPRLGEFCAWLGRGHKRELSLKIFSGAMWWRLWYNDDHGYDDYHRCDKWRKPIWPLSLGRKKYRSWMCMREGHIDLNPLDVIWGSKKFEYKTLDEKTKILKVDQFPDDRYEVHLKLQKVYRGREHGPSWVRNHKFSHWTVDWRCDAGIPVQNHSWKGDCILASAERIENPMNWWIKGIVSLRKRVEADRARHQYHPPIGPNDVLDALSEASKFKPVGYMPDSGVNLIGIPQKQSLQYAEYKDLPDADLEDVERWANMNNKEN